MDSTSKAILWQQFGASIDMVENALLACPDKLWSDRLQKPEYWYVVYHTLFWLDYYLSDSFENFRPPPPYNLDEMDPAGLLPDRVYSKDEMLSYLRHGRAKCRTTIEGLTDERARETRRFGRGEGSVSELLLYTMRHVQHHAAQLNLILRQKTDSAPRWVSRAKGDPGADPVRSPSK